MSDISRTMQKAIDRAKVQLMVKKDSVFVSTVLFNLHTKVSDQIPTAATNGLDLLLNEKWFLSLDPAERIGLLFHETFHVVFNHMARGKDLEHERYNIACLSKHSCIKLADGSYKELQHISPGDYVASPLGPNKVIGIACNGKQEVGLLNNKLTCTSSHKFLTDTGFKTADEYKTNSKTTNFTTGDFYVYAETQNETSDIRQLSENEFDRVIKTNPDKVSIHTSVPIEKRFNSQQIRRKEQKSSGFTWLIEIRAILHSWNNRWRRHNNGFYLHYTERTSIPTHINPSNQHILFSSKTSGEPWILWDSKDEYTWKQILANTAKRIWFSCFPGKSRTSINNKESCLQNSNKAMQRAHEAKEKRPPDSTYGKACKRSKSLELTKAVFRQRGGDIQEVFDLITEKGAYIAEGFVVHNSDHVINLIAKDAGYVMPKGGYCDKKYKGMDTLSVYNLLPPDECSPEGSGGVGTDIIYDTKATLAGKEMDLVNVLIGARQAAEIAGDAPGAIPGEIQVMLDELLNPKLPWEVILQNYMQAYAKEDYTWTRPNRRYMPEFYLPSARSEAVGHIAIAVDTSGSVSDEDFNRFRDEINGIKEVLKPEKISIVSFDTKIKSVQELLPDDDFRDIKFTGRGGTDIEDTWRWISKNEPIVTIIFSDMYFEYPSSAAGTDVIWIAVNNSGVEMPFGPTLHLSTE